MYSRLPVPIQPGSRLGPYEVLEPLGAGGMGEVWRGRDTRLDRAVAIKVLPGDFASNAQMRMRFEREAKTISQLTTGGIATADGQRFLIVVPAEDEPTTSLTAVLNWSEGLKP